MLVMAIGGIGLPGGAVYINTHLLRRRIYGALVSLGGPLATAVVLARPDGWRSIIGVQAGAARSGALCGAGIPGDAQVTALLFNLLPCPGLDGWGIIEPFLPPTVRE